MDQNAYVIQATGNICMVLLEIALQVHNAPKKRDQVFILHFPYLMLNITCIISAIERQEVHISLVN
jgi:hypothetical protein